MRTSGRDLTRGVLWQADELEKFAKPIMNKPKPKPKKEEKKEEEKKEGEGADGEAPAEAEAEAEAEGAHDFGRPDSFGLVCVLTRLVLCLQQRHRLRERRRRRMGRCLWMQILIKNKVVSKFGFLSSGVTQPQPGLFAVSACSSS